MTDILPSLPPGAWIGVIRLRSLGDTLLMTPALHALKAWRPDLRLAAVVEPRFADVLRGNPDLDAIIETPALRRLRALRPALVVGLHGGTSTARLARLSGARHRATFQGLRHRWAYNLLTPPRPGPLHTVEHSASLFAALGMPAAALGPLRLVPQAAPPPDLPPRFAFLSPDAREPGMRWPRPRFAALAAWLQREHGLTSVHASAGPAEPIAGVRHYASTSVADLIAIVARAECLIGSDGGPVHIAAALAKPVFVLYSSTDISVWAPWRTRAAWLQAPDLSSLALEDVTPALDNLLSSA